MKHRLALLALASVFTVPAWSAATVGQPAPAFQATDTSGKPVSLADYKGKHVVLEWTNPGCPFVKKHYDSANLPGTQKGAASQGVVWLTINSTSKDAGDYMQPAQLATWMSSKGGAPTATLMDESGSVGRAYGAKTTPHMYVIDPQGKLVYAGAIDDKPTTNVADIANANNYVKAALNDVLGGKPVAKAVTTPYGCAIKYASGA